MKTALMAMVLVACQSVAQTVGPVSKSDVRRYNLGLGRSVFTQYCLECHGNGQLGAPKLGVRDEWEARLDQPLPSLIIHALDGHGDMPPKGGFHELTEREVSAAVAYVVDQGRRLLLAKTGHRGESDNSILTSSGVECATGKDVIYCEPDSIEDTLLIQMLWLLSGQQR